MNCRCLKGVMVGVWGTLSCSPATTYQAPSAQDPCYVSTGSLGDTLYIASVVRGVTVAEPRPPHLAPYPPASDEFELHFSGRTYRAWGAPVLVHMHSATGNDQIVRTGTSGAVPVYAPVDPGGAKNQIWIYAPITESCVFLSYRSDT